MPNEVVEAIVAEFRQEVERYCGQVHDWVKEGGNGGLERWEEWVRELVQPIQRRLLEGVVEAAGRGYEGTQQRCVNCRGWARYVGDRPHRIRTLVGELRETKRAYYHGCGCAGGWFPQDRRLNLDAEGRSLGLRRVVTLMGAVSPYEKATDYLWEVGRIAISRTTVERVTEEVGWQVEEWQEARQQRALAGLQKREGPGPERLYVEADGTTVPMRVEPQQTRDAQQRVQAKVEYKEVKLGAVFEAHLDPEGKPEAGPRTYTGTFGDAQTCVTQVGAEAKACGADSAEEIVLLNDGGSWIWNRMPEAFAGKKVTQILDCRHPQERFTEIAKRVFGEGTKEARSWSEEQRRALLEGRIQQVIESIEKLAPKCKESTQYIRQALGYLRTNAHRMNYGELRAQGYYIGSGVIESACKHIVAARLKQAGMKWSRQHVPKVLALRVCRASGWWDAFWKERAQRAAA